MAGDKLDAAKRAITEVHASVLADEDRMALITFDNKAFFKLKPRPNGQLARQGEVEPLLSRIFAQGSTALYDAVWLALEQIADATRRTQLLMLTDGEDNSSTHTLEQVLARAEELPAVTLTIKHIGDRAGTARVPAFEKMTANRGRYDVITADAIVRSVRLEIEIELE